MASIGPCVQEHTEETYGARMSMVKTGADSGRGGPQRLRYYVLGSFIYITDYDFHNHPAKKAMVS